MLARRAKMLVRRAIMLAKRAKMLVRRAKMLSYKNDGKFSYKNFVSPKVLNCHEVAKKYKKISF